MRFVILACLLCGSLYSGEGDETIPITVVSLRDGREVKALRIAGLNGIYKITQLDGTKIELEGAAIAERKPGKIKRSELPANMRENAVAEKETLTIRAGENQFGAATEEEWKKRYLAALSKKLKSEEELKKKKPKYEEENRKYEHLREYIRSSPAKIRAVEEEIEAVKVSQQKAANATEGEFYRVLINSKSKDRATMENNLARAHQRLEDMEGSYLKIKESYDLSYNNLATALQEIEELRALKAEISKQ